MTEMPKHFQAVRAPLAGPAGHPDVRHGRIGVLLLNLGTPDGTSYWPMRRYLKEFLSDRRVIEVNPVIWWFVLNAVVLMKRPFTSGEAYRSIWNREFDESPLRTITRSQSGKIANLLKAGCASGSTGPCDMAVRASSPGSKRSRAKAATAFSSFPSIPNIRPRRRLQRAIRLSTR